MNATALSSASKLRLNISPANEDEDEFGWADEIGFSTQISAAEHGYPSAFDASSSSDEKSPSFSRNRNRKQQHQRRQLLPSLLTKTTIVKKEPSPVGNHGEEFYINYLKDRIQKENDDARNRQIRSQRTIRKSMRANNSGVEEELKPYTAQSSPELTETPIVRPFANNRFRLKTQNSLNSKHSK